MLYGEPVLAYAVAETLPITLLEPDPDWLIHLPNEYVRRRVWIGKLSDAFALSKPTFVKPMSITKPFTAGVYRNGEELKKACHVDNDEEVMMSEIVNWTSEYRCYVLDGKPMTISPYFVDGNAARDDSGEWLNPNPEESDAVRAFIADLLEGHAATLPRSIVIDAGRLDDGSIAVIEANSAWGSGLYGCDTATALDVIAEATITNQ
ncbi:MAG: ATP-grasp domain-containing protein [Planctomycetota bacterium]